MNQIPANQWQPVFIALYFTLGVVMSGLYLTHSSRELIHPAQNGSAGQNMQYLSNPVVDGKVVYTHLLR